MLINRILIHPPKNINLYYSFINFLDFQFGSYHFPSFNIADAAICVAVFLYLYSDLKARSQQRVYDAT